MPGRVFRAFGEWRTNRYNEPDKPGLAPMYQPRQLPHSRFVSIRGLRYHLRFWGDPARVHAGRPPLVLLHGWMDVGASFQFLVDELADVEREHRWVIAPDWRGLGQSEAPEADTFWFPDYAADLDALLDQLVPQGAVDLVGHSMGGHIAMNYAGLRPHRIRRLVNIEGFGRPTTYPHEAPEQFVRWLDELKTGHRLLSYASADAVAARLRKNNPLLPADKAAWLARQWASEGADGRWHIRANAAHKTTNPVLYRADEVLEIWKRITAPLLWVESDHTVLATWWGSLYPRSEFDTRLGVVSNVRQVVIPECGHMLHHDQPEALAAELAQFLA